MDRSMIFFCYVDVTVVDLMKVTGTTWVRYFILNFNISTTVAIFYKKVAVPPL